MMHKPPRLMPLRAAWLWALLLIVWTCALAGCGMLGGGQQSATTSEGLAGDLPGTSIPEETPDDLYDDEDEERGFLDKMRRTSMVRGTKKMLGLGPDRALAYRSYEEGDQLFKQGKYNEAAKKYKTAAFRWPDSSLEEDALFMQAECYFFTDKYPSASDTYANLLKKFENSRHLDKVSARQFAIARYWQQHHQQDPHWPVTPNLTDRTRPWFDSRGNSIAVYESIRLYDPLGPLADDSIMATANSYFLNDQFDDADYYYDLVRRDYPKSEHQATAHVLGLRSKVQKYQGAHYDATPIDEAEKLIDQTLVQFPDQIPEERERLLQARQAVLAQQAQRDWEMAEYYKRRKQHRAAAFYYNQVIKEHTDTRFAEMARERLVEIADLPPEPVNHFQWLTDRLEPETKRR